MDYTWTIYGNGTNETRTKRECKPLPAPIYGQEGEKFFRKVAASLVLAKKIKPNGFGRETVLNNRDDIIKTIVITAFAITSTFKNYTIQQSYHITSS